MKDQIRKFLIFVTVFSLIFTLTIGTYASNLENLDEEEITEQEEILDDKEDRKEEVKEEDKKEPEKKEKEEPKEEIKEEETKKEEKDKKEEKPKVKKEEVEKEKTEEKNLEKEEERSEDSEEKIIEEEVYDELAENVPPVMYNPFISIPMMTRAMAGMSLEDTIHVDKWAERILGLCRVYEVSLKITGEPQEAPVDVVLIIDKSGSMNESTATHVPITSAPTVGSYYVKIDGGYQQVTRHSGSGASSIWRYGNSFNRRYVKWDPNGDDNSHGSTNTNDSLGKPFYLRESHSRLHYAKEAAINFATKVLDPNGIPGSRVSLVTFSGPSTVSGNGNQNQAQTVRGLTSNLNQLTDDINGITAVGGTNTEAGFLQGRGVIENSDNPNSNKVVIMFTDGLPTASNGNRYAETTNINHIHNQRAIATGKGIYQDGVADVFTIGLLQGMNTAERNLALHILKETQNKGWYEAPTAADLDQIFNNISTQLGYAATNAKVVDKIGDNFNLIESSLPAGVTYDPSTREIKWNPGTIVEKETISYRIQAKSGFEGGLADTNEYAELKYTDVFGNNNKSKDFPVPQVDVPTLLEVSLIDASITLGDTINLGIGTDPNGDNYMSEITGGDGNGTYTYEWRIKGSSEIISTDKNPEVNPQEDTEYELTVIDSNGCKAIANMTVVVNKRIGEISITKKIENLNDIKELEFFDINNNSLFEETEFEIKVNGPSGYEEIIRIKHGETKILKELEFGHYQVEEINIDNKFQLMGIDQESFELTKEIHQVEVEVNNKINYYKYGIKKVNEDGEPLKNAEFKLRSGNIVDTVRTDADGIAWFKMLLPGQYTLEEIKAPAGYKLDDKVITITIGSDGEILTDPELEKDESDTRLLVIENNKAPGLPETGGIGTILFTVVGIGLMVIAYFLHGRNYE